MTKTVGKAGSGRMKLLKWLGKSLFLVGSVSVTLCAMTMCIISSFTSLRDLSVAMKTYLNVNKAVKVPSYDPPAIMILGNGILLYQCVFSQFRHDSKTVNHDSAAGAHISWVAPECQPNTTEFSVTLSELHEYGDLLEEFPDWLQKNLVTTIDASGCESDPSRRKRDSFDDRDVCAGSCGFLWDCANYPSSCPMSTAVFDNCFDPHTTFIFHEPCLTIYDCIEGRIRLPEQCGAIVECMNVDTIRDPSCLEVMECFHYMNRSHQNCDQVFQCLEDQIEHKCEQPEVSTSVPDLSQEELDSACDQIDDILEEDPSLAGQQNYPLSMIILKGPSDYETRDFIFASVRLLSEEKGAWIAIFPSHSEIMDLFTSKHKLEFLLYVIDNMRWTFAARFFKTFSFISKYEFKLEEILQRSDIRSESVISKLNGSSSFAKDIQPIELQLQWKDGYVISNNKFIGVSIWDAFAIIANCLLMLERAWLTWGRLSNKLVNTRVQIYLAKYKEGSPEYILIKNILDRSKNLVSVIWAFGKIRRISKRLSRIENKRRLQAERDCRREAERKRKILKYLALKYNVWFDDLSDLEMKRNVEWSIYRKMIRKRISESDAWQKHLEQTERERLEVLKAAIGNESRISTSSAGRETILSGKRRTDSRASVWVSLSDSPDPIVVRSRRQSEEIRKVQSKRVNNEFEIKSALKRNSIDSAQDSNNSPNSWDGMFKLVQ